MRVKRRQKLRTGGNGTATATATGKVTEYNASISCCPEILAGLISGPENRSRLVCVWRVQSRRTLFSFAHNTTKEAQSSPLRLIDPLRVECLLFLCSLWPCPNSHTLSLSLSFLSLAASAREDLISSMELKLGSSWFCFCCRSNLFVSNLKEGCITNKRQQQLQ